MLLVIPIFDSFSVFFASVSYPRPPGFAHLSITLHDFGMTRNNAIQSKKNKDKPFPQYTHPSENSNHVQFTTHRYFPESCHHIYHTSKKHVHDWRSQNCSDRNTSCRLFKTRVWLGNHACMHELDFRAINASKPTECSSLEGMHVAYLVNITYANFHHFDWKNENLNEHKQSLSLISKRLLCFDPSFKLHFRVNNKTLF